MQYPISLRRWIISFVVFTLAACAPSGGVYHTVQKGQTLFQIGQVYHVNDKYLARLNGIDDPTSLRIGEELFIPGANQTRSVPVKSATPAKASKPKPAAPAPARKAAAPVVSKKKSPPAASAAKASTATKGVFAWPLKGNVLQAFGPCGTRTYNGVEIGAPEETPIQAAAAGRVTYSGDGIRGYGNLIIIKHDDSFYTIYGFNRKNLVESGVFVSQGQQIALSGRPPSGGEPRLHFEIREGKSPVNPIFYLP
ncbi:MAG: M23 family metallopeptidase [Desulfuromonadales bacterium]|jgi:lipoprotein NlpD